MRQIALPCLAVLLGALSGPPAAGACTPSATTLCLQDGRFLLQGTYKLQDGQGTGPLRFFGLTPAAGYFTFADTSDVQAVVKVLDVCGFAQRFWVFIGALTDQEVHLEVTDTATGAKRIYENALKTSFLPIYDLDAFAGCSAPGISALTETTDASGGAAPSSAAAALSDALSSSPRPSASCASSSTAVCLGGGRFRLEGTFRLENGQGNGPLRLFPLSDASAYITYADTSDVQAIVKVLNVCGFAQRFWVFVGALTDQEVVLQVTDTETGTVRRYVNALKTPYLPIYDLEAFSTCEGRVCKF